ncbi:hypothetical protein [Kaistella polysaccharea]|uniref:hypothetical protein n=1 Tax=Kaistella polysaccharea TaxID=2878534 RepID=UPI001CF1B866|nr:hypothetical protein [Kaistella polysaccharea]
MKIALFEFNRDVKDLTGKDLDKYVVTVARHNPDLLSYIVKHHKQFRKSIIKNIAQLRFGF